jgi:YD repeat-containing protein
VVRYTHHEDGSVATREWVDRSSGIASWGRVTYDADGREVKTEADEDGNGVTTIVTSTYDANGYLTSITRDTNGDGIPEETTVRVYDGAGNLLHSDVLGPDGLVQYRRTYNYDCW